MTDHFGFSLGLGKRDWACWCWWSSLKRCQKRLHVNFRKASKCCYRFWNVWLKQLLLRNTIWSNILFSMCIMNIAYSNIQEMLANNMESMYYVVCHHSPSDNFCFFGFLNNQHRGNVFWFFFSFFFFILTFGIVKSRTMTWHSEYCKFVARFFLSLEKSKGKWRKRPTHASSNFSLLSDQPLYSFKFYQTQLNKVNA